MASSIYIYGKRAIKNYIYPCALCFECNSKLVTRYKSDLFSIFFFIFIFCHNSPILVVRYSYKLCCSLSLCITGYAVPGGGYRITKMKVGEWQYRLMIKRGRGWKGKGYHVISTARGNGRDGSGGKWVWWWVLYGGGWGVGDVIWTNLRRWIVGQDRTRLPPAEY